MPNIIAKIYLRNVCPLHFAQYSALEPPGHPSHPGVEGVAWLAEDPDNRYFALDPSGHPNGVLHDWRRIHAFLFGH